MFRPSMRHPVWRCLRAYKPLPGDRIRHPCRHRWFPRDPRPLACIDRPERTRRCRKTFREASSRQAGRADSSRRSTTVGRLRAAGGPRRLPHRDLGYRDERRRGVATRSRDHRRARDRHSPADRRPPPAERAGRSGDLLGQTRAAARRLDRRRILRSDRTHPRRQAFSAARDTCPRSSSRLQPPPMARNRSSGHSSRSSPATTTSSSLPQQRSGVLERSRGGTRRRILPRRPCHRQRDESPRIPHWVIRPARADGGRTMRRPSDPRSCSSNAVDTGNVPSS